MLCSISICLLTVSSGCRDSCHTKAVQRSLTCTRLYPTKGTASMWTNLITLRGQSLLWSLTLFVYGAKCLCHCSLELCKIFTAAINYLKCGSDGGRRLGGLRLNPKCPFSLNSKNYVVIVQFISFHKSLQPCYRGHLFKSCFTCQVQRFFQQQNIYK